MLSSGSGGNAVLVRAGELCLLVDAGLPIDELEQRLAQVRLPLHRLDAIALTHGHLDHARSAGLLARKSGARLYCSERMMSNASVRGARAFHALAGQCDGHGARASRARRARAHARSRCRTTRIRRTRSGSSTPGGARRSAPTWARPSEAAARALADVEILVLEFNHDAEMLASGPYSPGLKRRVGGPRGHLSNEQAAEVLRRSAGAGLHTLVLAHLSRTNNRPELALESAHGVLAERGLGHVRVLVAAQDQPGPSLEV